MSFFTYMLLCADESYYVGHTDDLTARVAGHQSALIPGYTNTPLPVTLVWSQDFSDRHEAFRAERQIKGWSRAKKAALVRGDWQAIAQLAKKPSFDTPLRQSSAATQDERFGKSRSGPVIVLVRPQLGQNIGKTARAMLNFGLTELRLVAPRDGWPNPDAGPPASGAGTGLDSALIFETTAQAIADCSLVYASTVRRRDLILPVVDPRAMAEGIAAGTGRSAILFGPERSGLETEDVALANAIVTVPINPDFGSLNLAQAVILLAYEWSRHNTLAVPTAREPEPQAAH